MERRPLFPGMDPWLEQPELWPDVHNSLIGSIRDALAASLQPRYFVRIEERAYIWSFDDLRAIGVPDVSVKPVRAAALSPPLEPGGVAVLGDVEVVEFLFPEPVTETFIRIVDAAQREVVTVIEVLSPSNKQNRQDRDAYIHKRDQLLESEVNFVEIDLMRAGEPLPNYPNAAKHDYRIMVKHAARGRRGTAFGFGVRSKVPTIPIPLRNPDPDVPLALNDVLHGLFDRACYHLSIDYDQPPVPPLRPSDVDWAAAIIRAARTPN